MESTFKKKRCTTKCHLSVLCDDGISRWYVCEDDSLYLFKEYYDEIKGFMSEIYSLEDSSSPVFIGKIPTPSPLEDFEDVREISNDMFINWMFNNPIKIVISLIIGFIFSYHAIYIWKII